MNDWWCDNCQFKIFGRKDNCHMCGRHRCNSVWSARTVKDIKDVKDVKKGYNDWWCTNCKFTVFGSKTHCKCGKSKEELTSNSTSSDCPICYTSDHRKKAFNCGHIICENCYKISKPTSCPMCRVTITTCIDLFL